MNIEQIEKIIKGLVGKNIVVTTEAGEFIFLWSTRFDCWTRKTVFFGLTMYDLPDFPTELFEDFSEIFRIEGVE